MENKLKFNAIENGDRNASKKGLDSVEKKLCFDINGLCINDKIEMLGDKFSYYEERFVNGKFYGALKFHEKNEIDDIKRKSKVYFYCEKCNFGSDGNWKLILDNALYGSGCPCCKSIDEVKDKFKKSRLSLDNQLEVTFTKPSNFSVNDIRYAVVNKSGVKTKSFKRSYIIKCCRIVVIPQVGLFSLNKKIEEIVSGFLDLFASGGKIKAVDKGKKTGAPPFFAFETGSRALMIPESSDCMSALGVNALIKKEKKMW